MAHLTYLQNHQIGEIFLCTKNLTYLQKHQIGEILPDNERRNFSPAAYKWNVHDAKPHKPKKRRQAKMRVENGKWKVKNDWQVTTVGL